MDLGALAVLRPRGRPLGRPLVEVRHHRRAEPGPLLHHLGHVLVRQIEAVLDRVALAVERAAHPDAVVRVAGHLFSLAVRLVDDRGELLDVSVGCETRLPFASTQERWFM